MISTKAAVLWTVIAVTLIKLQSIDSVPCSAGGTPAGCTDCTLATNAGNNDCLCAGADPVGAGCVTCQADATVANCLDCTLAGNAANAACVAFCTANPTNAACPKTTRRVKVTIHNLSYVVRRRIKVKKNGNKNKNNKGPSVIVVNAGK